MICPECFTDTVNLYTDKEDCPLCEGTLRKIGDIWHRDQEEPGTGDTAETGHNS